MLVGEPHPYVTGLLMSNLEYGLLGKLVCRLVTPPTDGLDVSFGQELEYATNVQVFLDRGSKQLEAGVPRKLLHLLAEI